MKVAVISNHVDPEAGYVGERLVDHGATLQPLWRDDLSCDAAIALSADLIVLLGSDWSVYDPVWQAHVSVEQELVRSAEQRGLPIFAICYGAQLVASALGSPVTRAERPEIGWMNIETVDPDQCPSGPWFQLHQDRFHKLAGIDFFAWSPLAPQGFWHKKTLATQFHPEALPETIGRWLESAPKEMIDAAGVDLAVIVDETKTKAPLARKNCFELVDRFLETVSL